MIELFWSRVKKRRVGLLVQKVSDCGTCTIVTCLQKKLMPIYIYIYQQTVDNMFELYLQELVKLCWEKFPSSLSVDEKSGKQSLVERCGPVGERGERVSKRWNIIAS